jgi:Integrase zinc binding domain
MDMAPSPLKLSGCYELDNVEVRCITLAECEGCEGYSLLSHFSWATICSEYEKLYVKLFRYYHDSPLASHPGCEKTYSLLARHYYP